LLVNVLKTACCIYVHLFVFSGYTAISMCIKFPIISGKSHKQMQNLKSMP